MLTKDIIKEILSANETQLWVLDAQVKDLGSLIQEQLKRTLVQEIIPLDEPRKPGRRSKYPRETILKVEELIKEGHGSQRISEMTGMNSSYVSTIKQRLKKERMKSHAQREDSSDSNRFKGEPQDSQS